MRVTLFGVKLDRSDHPIEDLDAHPKFGEPTSSDDDALRMLKIAGHDRPSVRRAEIVPVRFENAMALQLSWPAHQIVRALRDEDVVTQMPRRDVVISVATLKLVGTELPNSLKQAKPRAITMPLRRHQRLVDKVT